MHSNECLLVTNKTALQLHALSQNTVFLAGQFPFDCNQLKLTFLQFKLIPHHQMAVLIEIGEKALKFRGSRKPRFH